MAQDQQDITCPPDAWTQLTNADVTSITFQVRKGDVYIRATTDATAPTETFGILYKQGQGERNVAMSELVSLAGADRLWAKPLRTGRVGYSANVYVDHA